MFTPPRFVAIDDDPDHLSAIARTLQEVGTACLGIHYRPEEELDNRHFLGVRCLFMDLHLTTGIPSTTEDQHYGLIASILDDNISPDGGPFILVVWTSHPQLCDGLRVFLDTHLHDNRAHARPLAILPLAKERFINAANNTVREPDALRREVGELLDRVPQLAALLEWENDVLRAAGSTLSALVSLVPASKRSSRLFAAELDAVLSQLASAAVGKTHVEADPRSAVVQALVPILADHIISHAKGETTRANWNGAVTRYNDGPIDETIAGSGHINRMLHLASPSAETIGANSWGAVIDYAFGWTADNLRSKFDTSVDELLRNEFKIAAADDGKCKPILVRIGAACDYAQGKSGPICFLLGVLTSANLKKQKRSPSIWESPDFSEAGSAECTRMLVNSRMMITCTPSECRDWPVLYRMREQLLMQLITTASGHASRPGIVKL